jgi:hypothetical protein
MRYGTSVSSTFVIDLANRLAAFRETCTPYGVSVSCVPVSLSTVPPVTESCMLIGAQACRFQKLCSEVVKCKILKGDDGTWFPSCSRRSPIIYPSRIYQLSNGRRRMLYLPLM